ncbi:hypothetical protein QWY97_20050 [Vibrio cortegadensis]|uniref:hypothetical protein n=1 Tax=Vibrio cortegadensis TaxID=1328770 RepID=UPI0021C2A7EA|nr:hypothetical protein [Vibrio cortegadensis]MDN3699604.1 hypothetical protein [Vibrio cortegadensis]
METPASEWFKGSLNLLDIYTQDLNRVLDKISTVEFSRSEKPVINCFPDVTYKSHVLSVVIILEQQFSYFCTSLQNYTSQKLKWNDLKGSALERFIKYNHDVCGLDKPSCNELLQDLKGVIELRNCVIHNNSFLNGFSKSRVVEQLTKRVDGLEIKNNFIRLNQDACKKITSIIFNFLRAWYQSAINKFVTVL